MNAVAPSLGDEKKQYRWNNSPLNYLRMPFRKDRLDYTLIVNILARGVESTLHMYMYKNGERSGD